MSDEIKAIVQMLWNDDAIKAYRPIPFWSWNDHLEPEEMKRQIQWMKQEGFGGYFMHARGGLQTEYLSQEWFECIRQSVRQGQQLGMESWAYDENGWPSGFVGGKLLYPEENRDKYLTIHLGQYDADALVSYLVTKDHLIRIYEDTDADDYCLNVYAHTASSTVDILNPNVVDQFLRETHEQYQQQLGADFLGLKGFFTDEPQYYRWGVPYTTMLPKYFAREYHRDVLDGLGLLFMEKEGYREFRYQYWKALQQLMLKNFAERVYDWCGAHGLSLTGHYIEEPELKSQMLCCGGIMPFYEYETIPGIDFLYGSVTTPNAPKQVSSVACQLGKKQVLTETFAGCGWDLSAKQAKCIAEAQYVGGVNRMCQHLLPYSEHGQRKRDYPAHFSWANPWVRHGLRPFNDYFTRLGFLLGESQESVSVGVFCPIRSLYFDYKREQYERSYPINDGYNQALSMLIRMQIPYHILDETILQKHGRVENGHLVVGTCSYDTLVFPKTYTMDEGTKALLEEYVQQQGKLLFLDEKPSYVEGRPWKCSFESNISLDEIRRNQPYWVTDDQTTVRSVLRQINGQRFLYAVNCSLEASAELTFYGPFAGFRALDLESGVLSPMSTTLSFAPGQSYVLFLSDTAVAKEEAPKRITLDGPFVVKEHSDNYLLLDRVCYSLDGENYSQPCSCMGVFQELLNRRVDGDVYLKYHFYVKEIPERLFLLAEDMNNRYCRVNGHRVEFVGASDFEKQLYKADISSFAQLGENCIEICIHFFEDQQVYDVLFGDVTESLRNCLVYNTTVEACYLQGDFGVYSVDGFQKGEKDTVCLAERFYLGKTPQKISDSVREGFPFFAGYMTLEKEFSAVGEGRTELHLVGNFARCSVKLNGQQVKMSYFGNTADITEYLREGTNVVQITLYSGNRNLLGPHHYGPDEDPSHVSPRMFELPGTWEKGHSDQERSSYSFVRFGLFPT